MWGAYDTISGARSTGFSQTIANNSNDTRPTVKGVRFFDLGRLSECRGIKILYVCDMKIFEKSTMKCGVVESSPAARREAPRWDSPFAKHAPIFFFFAHFVFAYYCLIFIYSLFLDAPVHLFDDEKITVSDRVFSRPLGCR